MVLETSEKDVNNFWMIILHNEERSRIPYNLDQLVVKVQDVSR